MLYFLFKPQREPLDMIEVQLIVITSVVIEYVTEWHNLLCSVAFFIMAQLNYFHLVTWTN